MAMDPIIKAKWVKALRSGKYKQADGFMRRDNKFCCLGVFCDILAPDRWIKDCVIHLFDFGIGKAGHWWPSEFAERIGVPVAEVRELARLNDAGLSFKQIADYIEANL